MGVILLLFAAACAQGAAIVLQSNGTTPSSCASSPICEFNNVSGANFVIPIDEPSWTVPPNGSSPNLPAGAEWISFENTGWEFNSSLPLGGEAVITLPNRIPPAGCPTGPASDFTAAQMSECGPNAIFFETFTDTQLNLMLSLTVWADDTAAVFLDGNPILSPNFSQGTTNCAPTGFVTCIGSGSTYSSAISSGTHTLEFDVYQTGGNTYGLLYDGLVTGTSSTPEPATYGSLAAGLIALFALRRTRKSLNR